MEGNGVMMAGRPTKLPSIRGFSFASRPPAGVGLAGIASSKFRHVSLPSAFFEFFSQLVHCAGMLGAKSPQATS